AAVQVLGRTTLLKPRDGNPVPERDIPEFIGRALHEDIADFFLFDGEMLNRFEERLRQDAGATLVKQSIERVLGLPALQLAKSDLNILLDGADSRLRREVSREKEAHGLESDRLDIDTKLETIERDIADLRTQGEAQEGQVRALGAQMSRIEEIK